MSPAQLLRWQWDGYPRNHAGRFNLLLHVLVVPVFLVGNVVLVVAILRGSWLAAVLGGAAMAMSVALQGRGHARERVAPEPFTGAANALGRIFVEQWITFPRFVLSGGWLAAWRRDRAQPADA